MDLSGKGKSEFGVLPAGWYQACITKAEIRPTKDGTGKYINTTFTITGHEYSGRMVFHMYNLENKNPKAVEIAEQQVASALIEIGYKDEKLRAITLEEIPGMLINKSVGIKLKIQVDTSGVYGDKNVVVGYKQVSGTVETAASGPVITTADIPF